MLSNDDEILIEKFFDGEITTEELLLFKLRISEDAEFKQAVELQQAAVTGIGLFGKQALKAELTDIHNEVKGDLKKYKPGKGGASIIGTVIKWLVALAILAAAYYAYLYFQEHNLPAAVKQLPDIIEKDQTPSRDTVYHTIKTHTTVKRDTVIYGEENMKKYLEENKNAVPTGSKSVIIKRDTVYSQ